jgi:hypothetical protein
MASRILRSNILRTKGRCRTPNPRQASEEGMTPGNVHPLGFHVTSILAPMAIALGVLVVAWLAGWTKPRSYRLTR